MEEIILGELLFWKGLILSDSPETKSIFALFISHYMSLSYDAIF